MSAQLLKFSAIAAVSYVVTMVFATAAVIHADRQFSKLGGPALSRLNHIKHGGTWVLIESHWFGASEFGFVSCGPGTPDVKNLGQEVQLKALPKFVQREFQRANQARADAYCRVLSSGLPFRCAYLVELQWTEGGVPYSQTRGAFNRATAKTWNLGGIPFLPAWPGLLLNMASSGTAVSAAVWGVPGFRRWKRRRAGRCEQCAYDRAGLRGAPCPECGFEPT